MARSASKGPTAERALTSNWLPPQADRVAGTTRLRAPAPPATACAAGRPARREEEGQVNRIKMFKRQMFGRAGFALLRKRVLLSS
ncbi:hypothetical protein CNQ36_34305 (plasmid) [Streptomyces fungicidicus]|uniref:Transposase n=1 Tax=Streptomyces fungicidicus TaxID=68203 RepID=A0A494VAS2_9ACTN|nr:hypothetical protein CNQ36_34305 [Streptomyces fungicidicus]